MEKDHIETHCAEQKKFRQMMASQAVKRLQELIELYGDLKVDGLPNIQFWPADKEGPAFFYVEAE